MKCINCRYYNQETHVCDPKHLAPNWPYEIQNPNADIECSVFDHKFNEAKD